MNGRHGITDDVAAAAFWRLVDHLDHRRDVQNIDLMGQAGFCRNCLSEWLEESAAAAGKPIGRAGAREAVYGIPYEQWKAEHQPPATPEQLARMEESLRLNKRS
jgi:hypothetical protein